MKIVLASLSPRRKELLKTIKGIEFEVRPSYADEELNFSGAPELLTMMLAEKKAQTVIREGEVVLGADTVVVCDQIILTKPTTEDEAIDMLMSLSGRKHTVITGICLLSSNRVVYGYDKSIVEFKAFGVADIISYVNDGKSFDKSGGYGIQDGEIKQITRNIEGSLTNIIGLPVELLQKIFGEHV